MILPHSERRPEIRDIVDREERVFRREYLPTFPLQMPAERKNPLPLAPCVTVYNDEGGEDDFSDEESNDDEEFVPEPPVSTREANIARAFLHSTNQKFNFNYSEDRLISIWKSMTAERKIYELRGERLDIITRLCESGELDKGTGTSTSFTAFCLVRCQASLGDMESKLASRIGGFD
jgi:hypothetical protein